MSLGWYIWWTEPKPSGKMFWGIKKNKWMSAELCAVLPQWPSFVPCCQHNEALGYKHLPLSCAKAALKALIFPEKMRDLAARPKVCLSIISVIGILILLNPWLSFTHVFIPAYPWVWQLRTLCGIITSSCSKTPTSSVSSDITSNPSRLRRETLDGQRAPPDRRKRLSHGVLFATAYVFPATPPRLQECRKNDTHSVCRSFFNENLAVRFSQWVVWLKNRQQRQQQ